MAEFLEKLNPAEVEDTLSSCTKRQVGELKSISHAVACRVFPIISPGGIGKTTVSLRLFRAALQLNPLVGSGTNAAVNNICRRADLEDPDEEYLIRVHPDGLELAAL